MSDWSMYELEDISWEEFGRSDDHIVPRCGNEHARGSVGHDVSLKRQHHEVGTAIAGANDGPTTSQKADKISGYSSLVGGRPPPVESSWSHACTDVSPEVSSDPQGINRVSVLASQGSRTSDSHFTDRKAEDKGLQLLQCGNGREHDILFDYEWDNIGNFENVDRMFRNCGTAFGQGSIGCADELSWFSSSSQIDGCADTFSFGIQSSYPELSPLDKSLKPTNEANTSFLLENGSLSEAHDRSSLGYCDNTHWLDTKVEDSGEVKLPKSQCKTTKRRKNRPSETKNGLYVHDFDVTQSFEWNKDTSSTSSLLETSTSSIICLQNPFPRANSNYAHQYDYNVKMENGPVIQNNSFKKSASCVESEVKSNISPSRDHGHQSVKSSVHDLSGPPTIGAEGTIDKRCHKKQSNVPVDGERTCENFTCQVSSSNQRILKNKFFTPHGEAKSDTELAGTSIECPKYETDYLPVQENSVITVFSDDILLGSASFRKLQDVLDQLDVRTKLCMRDGLYRLARNAEMRHCVDSPKQNRTGSRTSSRIPRMEEAQQSSEFIVETGTNPIDRSIAHLLFNRASDSSTCPINYAMSHKSHITNEHNPDSSTDA